MELAHAKAIAHQIVDAITPHCALVDIAGSIRRQKPWVKDIEILCLLPNPNKMFMALQPFIAATKCAQISTTEYLYTFYSTAQHREITAKLPNRYIYAWQPMPQPYQP